MRQFGLTCKNEPQKTFNFKIEHVKAQPAAQTNVRPENKLVPTIQQQLQWFNKEQSGLNYRKQMNEEELDQEQSTLY
jgi:hypothetical protein